MVSVGRRAGPDLSEACGRELKVCAGKQAVRLCIGAVRQCRTQQDRRRDVAPKVSSKTFGERSTGDVSFLVSRTSVL